MEASHFSERRSDSIAVVILLSAVLMRSLSIFMRSPVVAGFSKLYPRYLSTRCEIDFLSVGLCVGMAAILGSPLELPKLIGILDTKYYLTQWPTEGAFCDFSV